LPARNVAPPAISRCGRHGRQAPQCAQHRRLLREAAVPQRLERDAATGEDRVAREQIAATVVLEHERHVTAAVARRFDHGEAKVADGGAPRRPGDIAQAHSHDEDVEREQLRLATRVYLLAAAAFLEAAAEPRDCATRGLSLDPPPR
jgi:hypothetical protein